MAIPDNSKSIREEFNRQKTIVFIGCVIFSLGLWLLLTNEGRAVKTAHSLDKALTSVIMLNPYEPVLPEYDERLVYIAGRLLVEEPLTEPEYGISVQAVKLKRRAQMLQWVEEATSTTYYGGDGQETVNYHYTTDWRDKLVDSNSFYIRTGHHNPKEIPIKSQIQIAEVAKVGPLTLSLEAKKKFHDYFEITSDERPDRRDIKMHMGLYYHTDDVWNPEVGDIRIQFSYAGPSGQEVTVVGQQKGNVIKPFVTEDGYELLIVRPLIHTLDQMFSYEHSDLRWENWKIRGFGWALLFISLNCLAEIIHTLLSRIPMFKNILVLDSTIYTNMAVATSIALIVMAIAWIWHRPLMGVGLFMAATAPFLYCTINYNPGAPINRDNYNRL